MGELLRPPEGGGGIGCVWSAAIELLSRKVETAASRSHWWDSKKKRASSLEEEVISIKELIKAAF